MKAPITDDKGISVVIVNWNGLGWLERLLSSLANQNYVNYEVIFVDNNSTDKSVEYVKANFPEVKIVISSKNLGFAGGNNLGIKHSNKDNIMLLNSDTWIDDDFILNLYNFKSRSNLDVVAPLEATYGKVTKPPYITTIDVLGHPVYLHGKYAYERNMYLSGVCILFKKNLYTSTGGLDGNFFMYFEEIDWFWRLKLMGKTFGYANDLYVYHAGAGSGDSETLKYKSFLWRNENTLQMLLKNYATLSLFLVLPLYVFQNMLELIVFIFVKPVIAKSYVLGIVFNFENFNRTMKARGEVQKLRTVSDIKILASMYMGFGKAHHLIKFIGKKIREKKL